MDNNTQKEISRRRTFGIISHPDAGKTTLTEKLLLFGGAIQQAGAVKAKHAARYATSDWMSIEKERGISVTTSVMKFNYRNFEINLLDTPGHQDFSEDTYRVLTAVDSALMVIDSAKGVEAQTEKLMEVCRMRNTPIITFINKLDREGLAPAGYPGRHRGEAADRMHTAFLADRHGQKLQRGLQPLSQAAASVQSRQRHPRTGRRRDYMICRIRSWMNCWAPRPKTLREDIELIEGAANPFEKKHFLKASQTPVFFGSAINNFGVKEMLDAFVELAPPPGPRAAVSREVSPYEESFSGFAFQNPGQYESGPSRPDRVCQDLLRQIHAGDEGGSPPHRQRSRPGQCDHLHGPGPRQCRRRPFRETSSASTTTAPSRSATPSAKRNL